MPQPPSRFDNLRTLRIANIDGAFSTAFATLVSGTFLVGFIKMVGGSDLWIGLLAAIPSLMGILQIPGGIWGRGFASYKVFVLPGGLIWRLFHLPLIFLPLVALTGDAKLTILAFCIGLAAAAVLIVQPIYNDWLAEMVPSSSRGWFFSRRNALAVGVGASVGLVGGLLLDHYRRLGNEPLGFTVIFSIGLVCAGISFFFFSQMRDLPRPHPIRENFKQSVRSFASVVRDRSFRGVLVFLILFIAGQTIAGNLFSAYALESLNMPFTILQLMALCHAAGNVLASKMWGFLADKYGNKPILAILGVGMFLTPIPWLLTFPGKELQNTIVLLSSHVVMGAIWSGVMLCQFNLLLATARPEDRANYIGVGLATQAIVGGIAPLVGAQIVMMLRTPFPPEMAYKGLFLVTMAIRLIAVGSLLPVVEPGAARIRETIRHLRRVTPKGYRALRELTSATDPRGRETAIRQVASQGFLLAGDEIVKALSDPSPRVRRQAAMALAKLSDPMAESALIRQIEEHPDLVEEETIEALGEVGGPNAVSPLIDLLQSPRSVLRRAAAKALGRLGQEEAIGALLVAAHDTNDVEVRRASLQALRMIGSSAAEEAVKVALLDPHPSIRIAAAEAVSELELRDCAPELRESLRRFNDDASCEVAYALGVVGHSEDLAMILTEAREMPSAMARRRCLLGVARMLGAESEAFRLMRMEGMSRDSVLLSMLGGLSRQHAKAVQTVLELYSSGQEADAVRTLVEATQRLNLQPLVEHPVEDSFLVAVAAVTAAESA